MTRALLYLRQSDTDGQGERSLSLDSQATVLREAAALHGWAVVSEVRDPDLKGYDDRRPGLLTLYEQTRAGAVDVVAFWKLDRLARSLRLQENVLHELEQLGVEVWSHQDPHIGTPLFRQVLGAFNEELTRIIAANVRRAIRERARRNQHHGRAPFGYLRTEQDTLEPSPDAEIARMIFRLRADGRSLMDIRSWLADHHVATPNGNPLWGRSQLGQMFHNPAYIGAVRCGEVVIEGAHEPIVPRETWERVQDVLVAGRRRAPRQKPVSSWLEGLVVHACDTPMFLEGASAKNAAMFRCPRDRWYASGACPMRPRTIVMARAERLAWEAICDDFSRLRTSEAVYREAELAFAGSGPAVDAMRRAAEQRKRDVAEQRGRIENLYISGQRDRAWFDARDAAIASEARAIAAELAQLPTRPCRDDIDGLWERLNDMRGVLAHIEPQDRGAWLRTLGVAVVSPAGYKDVANGSRPGPKPDAGLVRIRYRPEIAPFLANPGL